MGIKISATLQLDAIVADETLLRWYVQRIIARRDVSRLTYPAVLEGVRAALGLHRELAPELAALLTAESQPS